MFSIAQLIQASLILSQFLYALRLPQPIENCVLVTGATGYIGRSVVRELVDRKIPTVAVVRSNDISDRSKQYLKGSTIVVSNVCDSSDLTRVYNTFSPAATICCLASRSGVKRDTWAIDYEASLNCLRAQESVLSKNQFSNNLNHFVLLSAYCVGKPLLQFHYAKLKLEAAIRASSLVSHSIVRPTAFFKSVDGQFESVTKGFPTLYFGDGSVRANPISEKDLAEYLVTCATNPQQLNLLNRTIDIGGPDQPLSKFQQLQLIYDTLNIPTGKRRSIPIPMEVLDTIINSFQFLEKVCGNLGMEKYSLQCQDAAEIARIVRYYAQEDMVTTQEEQKYGRISLLDHYNEIARRGGKLEEIDRMTTTTGVFELFAKNQYMSKE